MTPKPSETRFQNAETRLSRDADNRHPTTEQIGCAVRGDVSPSPSNDPAQREQPLNFVGLGSHLPWQRGRPRGTAERFGTRPENWPGLWGKAGKGPVVTAIICHRARIRLRAAAKMRKCPLRALANSALETWPSEHPDLSHASREPLEREQ